MTTPISDPASRRDAWNLLPTGDEPWPFVMLANEMMYYLVGSGQQRLNYLAGDTAVVHLGAGREISGLFADHSRAAIRFARPSTKSKTP